MTSQWHTLPRPQSLNATWRSVTPAVHCLQTSNWMQHNKNLQQKPSTINIWEYSARGIHVTLAVLPTSSTRKQGFLLGPWRSSSQLEQHEHHTLIGRGLILTTEWILFTLSTEICTSAPTIFRKHSGGCTRPLSLPGYRLHGECCDARLLMAQLLRARRFLNSSVRDSRQVEHVEVGGFTGLC